MTYPRNDDEPVDLHKAGGPRPQPHAADPYSSQQYPPQPYAPQQYPPQQYPAQHPPPGGPGPYGPPYQQPWGYPQGYPQRSTNGMAIAAMILGILWIYWIGSILAVIFGFVARNQIKQRRQDGDGMAIAGLVLGWIGVGTLLIVIGLGVTVSGSSFN